MKEKEYYVVNIDCTVVLEHPQLNPHIPEMQSIIANLLELESDQVSIKATTHEMVDSFGNLKAIKAYCACLLNKQ